MEVSEAKRLRGLEEENSRLKRLAADPGILGDIWDANAFRDSTAQTTTSGVAAALVGIWNVLPTAFNTATLYILSCDGQRPMTRLRKWGKHPIPQRRIMRHSTV